MRSDFYDGQTGSSAVKTSIVGKYFGGWASVILRHTAANLAYVDLFCGPGRYRDGNASTPIVVLEKAIADRELRSRLVTVFNDADSGYVAELKREVAELPGIDTLTHPPALYNEPVSRNLIEKLRREHAVPWLLFADPWGYKGLTVDLIVSVVENWGCDCLFFFNYNRVSMHFANVATEGNLDLLFGDPATVQTIRQAMDGLSGRQREEYVVRELKATLRERASVRLYVVPFRFREEGQRRCSHYLVFVSKNRAAYQIIKNVMFAHSSATQEGVATFEYDPALGDYRIELLEVIRPVTDLAADLAREFAGRTMQVGEVIGRHDEGDNYYTARNYKDALLQLEKEGRVVVVELPGKRQRRAGALGDERRVSFR